MDAIDEAKKGFDACQDARERVATFSNSLQHAGAGGWMPGWWGFFRKPNSGVNIVNQKSNDWWPLVIVAIVALFIWWKPAEPAKPLPVAPSFGTATWQKQRKDGGWDTFTSQPTKELPDGRIQTQDGRIWTRNPDGTLSEVK